MRTFATDELRNLSDDCRWSESDPLAHEAKRMLLVAAGFIDAHEMSLEKARAELDMQRDIAAIAIEKANRYGDLLQSELAEREKVQTLLEELIAEVFGVTEGATFHTTAEAIAEVARIRADRERLEVQLAGCGVAALGWSRGNDEAKQGDYGWSASYGDVVTIRKELEKARDGLAAARACLCSGIGSGNAHYCPVHHCGVAATK